MTKINVSALGAFYNINRDCPELSSLVQECVSNFINPSVSNRRGFKVMREILNDLGLLTELTLTGTASAEMVNS